ncbi:uncharacterized protein LOC131892089 [Tigriopus californicus]|uniref:uncharacterized protein LOC131892089 n=1 Tax=Tigriopus californicus TaxID=6832 RepID=UPI0027DA115F|nr:uncharacterized protein LOC131892089 [Tigriopus californicus]
MISLKTMSMLISIILMGPCFVHGATNLNYNLKVSSPSSNNSAENKSTNSREARVFSLFNVVKFQNGPCESNVAPPGGSISQGNRHGTCYTFDECRKAGGATAGKCASGFGVCCLFVVKESGTTVTRNCTYLENPGSPNPYGSSSQVSYQIAKCCANVCQLRLDFESFVIQGTGNTLELDTTSNPPTFGGICKDRFTVSVATGSFIPTICGQNTGQHIYADIGNLDSDTAQLNFQFDGSTSLRQWAIKVTQIPCYSVGHPHGAGCLQYHTGLSGRLTTFNFIPTNDNHLANQDYSICIRQELGFCCVEYTVCPEPGSFNLDTQEESEIDTYCKDEDYIGIEGGEGTCSKSINPRAVTNKFCGLRLNILDDEENNGLVCDCTPPFQVDIFTDQETDRGNDPNERHSRGVCLLFKQIPC